MINYQGIVKPSFHAYRMLNELGDEKVFYSDPVMVSRNSSDGKVTAIAFNYPESYTEKVPSAADVNKYMESASKDINLTLTNMTPGAHVELELLDDEHGNVIKDYRNLGSPTSLSKAQTDHLRKKSWDTAKKICKVGEDGQLQINETLSPWSCMLIHEI